MNKLQTIDQIRPAKCSTLYLRMWFYLSDFTATKKQENVYVTSGMQRKK